MAESNVDIILRFITDKKGTAEAQDAIDQLAGKVKGVGKSLNYTESLASISKYAEKTGQTVDAVMSKVQQVANATGASFNEAAQQVSGFEQNVEQAGKQVEQTGEKAKKTGHNIYALIGGFGSFYLSFAGRDLTKFGEALLSPLQKFIELENGSGVGAEWANSMKRVENSITRIGAVMASTLLPALRKAADLAEKIADFSERHPQLVTAGLAVGVGALALGKILTTLASIGMLFSAGITLGAVTAPTAGLGTAMIGGTSLAAIGTGIASAVATALATALPLLIGAWIAKNAVNTYRKNAGMDEIGYSEIFETGKQAAALINPLRGLSEALRLVGADKASATIWNLNKAIYGLGETTAKTVQELALSREAVDAFIQYQKQEAEALKQYENERAQIVQEGGERRAELEAQYEEQRNSIIANYASQRARNVANYEEAIRDLDENYNLQRQRAYEDLQRSLQELDDDFHEQEKRAAEDHQREMARLLEEHNVNVDELVRARDALGLVKENARYEREKREAEEKYREDAARREEDYQRQRAELERNFAIQEQQRKEDYERQRAEKKEDFELQAKLNADAMKKALEELDKKHREELRKQEEAEQKKLQELDESYRDQRRVALDAFQQQMFDLEVFVGNQKVQWDAYYAYMEQKLKELLEQMKDSTPTPTNVPTGFLQTAAKITGGSRSSLELLSGLLGKANNIIINQTLRFSGELGASDKRHIQKIARESAVSGVFEAIGV